MQHPPYQNQPPMGDEEQLQFAPVQNSQNRQASNLVPPPAQIDPQFMPPSYPNAVQQSFVPNQNQQNAPLPPMPEGFEDTQSPPFSAFPVQEQNEEKKGYRTPGTGIPRGKRRKIRPLSLFLVALVLIGSAFLIYKMLMPSSAAHGYVTGGTLSSRYQGDALIVRNETVYTQEGVSKIDYEAEEGQNVQRTDNICTVYTSGFNLRELQTLEKYRNQITDYHKVLIHSASNDAKLASLDVTVRDRAKEVRQLVAGQMGSLVNQEQLLKQALTDRRTYLKQKYPDDQKLTRLYDDENTQLQRISSWTKQYAATLDGIVSFYTDGYEAALNLTNYAEFTPPEVRALYQGKVKEPESKKKNTMDIYRLVKNNDWVVLMLVADKDWTPIVGRTYKLLIESFESMVVDATVESFTRSGGELLVRLNVKDADVKNVLYIRSCRVQLGENVDSLTVPTRALYSQNGQIGVVITDDMGNNFWTPVTVISAEGDVTHIIPNNAGYLYEGMRVKLF